MGEDAYDILMERLGFTASTRLRRIMQEAMTLEQARIVVELPGTPQEVAEKIGIDVDRVKKQLDELFFKGGVAPLGDYEKRERYRFAREILSFHDWTLVSRDRDIVKDRKFFELWDDFATNEMYKWVAFELMKPIQTERPQSRIVPAYRSIKDLPDVLPWENFHELLKAQDLLALCPCACRTAKAVAGKPCQRHDELKHHVCLQCNRSAEFVIARGSGRKITIEEALELNDNVIETLAWFSRLGLSTASITFFSAIFTSVGIMMSNV